MPQMGPLMWSIFPLVMMTMILVMVSIIHDAGLGWGNGLEDESGLEMKQW